MASPVFSTPRRPIVIGHRGASGHALENSFAAFRIAATPGHIGHCDGVELDVHTTSDGYFVVHHDPVLSSGDAIATTPFSRVRATLLRDGSVIPTLDEAIAILDGVELFVEAKGLPPSADIAFIALLAQHTNAAHHVHAFDHRIVARLRDKAASLSLGVLSSSYLINPLNQVKDAGADTLWQEASLIDAELGAQCEHARIGLIAWTVNDRAEAQALAALGVDGLCGNWPERLRS